MKIKKKTYVALFLIVFATCMMITSYIIAGQHTNTLCDVENGKIIVLSLWMRINAGFLIGFIVGHILIIVFSKKSKIVEYGAAYSFLYFICISIMCVLGFIQLFKYSQSCRVEEPSLWNMSLALLIFDVITMIYSVLVVVVIFYGICCDDYDFYE